jgi:hypothetical protein
MGKVEQLRRIIKYNRTVEDVLVALEIPFIRMYQGSTRPFEVQIGRGRPALIVTCVPAEDSMMKLIIMPVGMFKMTSIQDIQEILLKQKLYQFFKEIA